MPFDISDFAPAIQSSLQEVPDDFMSPSGLQQLAIILGGILLAWLLGKRLEKKLEAWAHNIKGNADLLRLIVALMRRMRWVVLVGWLFLARLALRAGGAPDSLVTLALMLSATWLALAVLTRVIRNRTMARCVAVCGWVYVAVLVLGLERPVTQALDHMAFTFGTLRISTLDVIKTIIVASVATWLAVFVGRLLENQLNRAEDISPSYKVLLGKLTRVTLVVLAGMIALTAVGIDLTALTVLSGAIGLGLGFGLQKVVSNFISGIIILLDRSVKPGDTIALGDTFGWIHELRARFVSVITRDGKKYLIPNEDFITQQVINWSYSDQYVRLDVDFGVSYDSDPHEVTRIAIDAAKSVARVVAVKEPVCWLTAFGDFSLQLRLRFWIVDPQNGLTNVRGQVLLALWDAFKSAGIQIPFPRQELAVRGPVEVVVQDST